MIKQDKGVVASRKKKRRKRTLRTKFGIANLVELALHWHRDN